MKRHNVLYWSELHGPMLYFDQIQDHLDTLQQQYRDSVNQRESLKQHRITTGLRLKRASILIDALGGEKVRNSRIMYWFTENYPTHFIFLILPHHQWVNIRLGKLFSILVMNKKHMFKHAQTWKEKLQAKISLYTVFMNFTIRIPFW